MTFANEHTVKSVRKARACCACGKSIEVGSQSVEWAGINDGHFDRASYHVDCRAAEIALNNFLGTCYDEWLSLSDIEDEDWPFLLQEHPAVAARLGLSSPEQSGGT